jgi:chromosome segregation ATPase
MKNKTITLTLLALVLFAAGCKPSQDTAAKEQIAKVEAETQDASAKMKSYTYAQKDQFVADMQAQLASLNQDLDKLATDISNASDQVKAEAQPKLQALRDQAAQLNQQLDQAKSADEATWDNVKASFNDAYDKAKDSFNDARAWLSQKISP